MRMIYNMRMLVLAFVVSIPLVASARITRGDLETNIPYSSDLIGRLRACGKFDQESMRYDNAAADTEAALFKYIWTSGIVSENYPVVVSGKATVTQQMELGQLQLLQRTDSAEIRKVCLMAELSVRKQIVFLLEGIGEHLKGKRK